MSLAEKLAAPFPPEAVSWRVGSLNKDKTKAMALAYIDARDVMDRLDEVCGPFGWQSEHVVTGDMVTCHIRIRDPETGEWITKSDGAGKTDVEGEKGSYSDSLKRSAVAWGIARYLYSIPSPWVAVEPYGRSYKIVESEKPKLLAALRTRPAPAAPPAGAQTRPPPPKPAAANGHATAPPAPGVDPDLAMLSKACAKIKGEIETAKLPREIDSVLAANKDDLEKIKVRGKKTYELLMQLAAAKTTELLASA